MAKRAMQIKMNPKIKVRWIKALLSGKYSQGKDTLRNADIFCCLGVLCDLAAKSKRGKWEDGAFADLDYAVDHLGPPPGVCEWAGVPESTDESINHPFSILAKMNDAGKKFPTIAKWIEKNL